MSDNVYIYENDVTWSLPCLFQYEAVFGALQHFIQMLGFKYFKAELYGAPSCLWTGGRKPVLYEKMTPKLLSKLFEYLKNYNATPVLAFNNTQLKPDDFKDEYCNMLLDTALEYDAKFMVFNDDLKNYIKNKNPNAYVIASVLKPVFYFQGPDRIEEPNVDVETQFYENLAKEYDMVALRAEYSKFILANNTTLLKDLSKYQVLINQSCLCNCNSMPLHTRHNERFNLTSDVNKDFVCPKMNLGTNIRYQNNSMHTQNEIQTLLNAGIKNLKLKGRGGLTDAEDMLHIIASWILRSDGANYLTVTGMGQSHVEAEVDYFNVFIRQQENQLI